ncbi:pimeloyl-ACP methyl ester esterase BioH [Budvicia aquatica]|uniref:Pimeloyl-[acyl-carrier protein] methyl ester esterase n=1 Tax=Budvicia aquatica TaxID=82979 RepID=A0A2C6BUW9_9GAMM|nr:pimeloyl-ACP methyl ester esterase BioH [Budvicia aquatica]PHI27950.1 pimeloyl-[acyl-carrier protein] methyl ester esterase [Budvicia aquatica]VFS45693.1 Pimelyl-[acyl-carrier protein] methyl ester esterase [Budvicia aquatica]
MSSLYWQTVGEGDTDLVLLHGWGLNSGIWHCITERLAPHFRLHLVDLPGYGHSRGYGAMSLKDMAEIVLQRAPEKAVWLGWSMGGLIASRIALDHPERVTALITVASSPCHIEQADEKWPGIKPAVLAEFDRQLNVNFQQTVEQFLALQTLGAPTARDDALRLKQVVFSAPMPEVEVLSSGLVMLELNDLRAELVDLKLPFLRIYGALDALVPRRVIPMLDSLWPCSYSVLINKASHAPFISHSKVFCAEILFFSLIYNCK